MKRRKMSETWALFMVGLVLSGSISSGLASRLPYPGEQQHQQLVSLQQQARQADGSLLTTLLNLALQYGPVLFKTFFSGDGAQQQTTDRIEELEIKEEDPLSTSNLITMAIKVALALFSNATSDGIDKSDVQPSILESSLGIVISALTGSKDPSEVSTMAKQASEVVNMLITLVEALQTSFSSS